MDDRLRAVEGRMEALESNLALLDARVDDRLSRMEGLLHLMLGHFGVNHHQELEVTDWAMAESHGSAQLGGKGNSGLEIACAADTPGRDETAGCEETATVDQDPAGSGMRATEPS